MLTHCITVDPPDAVIDAVPDDPRGRTRSARGGDEPIDVVAGAPERPRVLHLHRGHDRAEQGLHAPAELHRQPRRPDRARVGARSPTTSMLTPLPLFHFNAISVCVVGTLLVGGSAAIERRFSVSNFWPEIKRTGATMVSMLGSLAILIANADDHPDQAGPQAAAVRGRADAARHRPHLAGAVRVQDVQRAATASPRRRSISMLDAGEHEQARRDGQAEPPRVRGAHRRRRRRRGGGRRGRRDRVPAQRPEPDVRRLLEPAATRPSTRPRNLWFHTGDLGRLDDDGFIYFVDRKKDALRRRGENISSFEMEKTLYGHPAIARRRGARGAERARRGRREDHGGAAGRRAAHRGGAVPLDGRAGAVLRDPALRRVPRRPAPQPRRPGAQVPAPRRGRDRRRPGTAKPPASIRTPLGEP